LFITSKVDAKAKLTVQRAIDNDGIVGLIDILKCHFNVIYAFELENYIILILINALGRKALMASCKGHERNYY